MNTRTFQHIVPFVNYAWWETLLMRLGYAVLLFLWFPPLDILPPFGSELPFPNGLGRLGVDFSWALHPQVFPWLQGLLVGACVVYVVGWAYPIAVTALFFCYLVVGTLHNSLGSISHYYQMLTLILLGQALASWIWTFLPGNAREVFTRSPAALHSFTTRVTLQLLAGNYVLCALTKLLKSKGLWIWNSQYMPVEFAKIEAQKFHNNLVPVDMGLGSAFNDFCLQHPWLCMVIYAPGLIVELFAFLLLFGRGWAFWTGLVVIGMHAVIKVTMNLDFPQHKWMVFIFAVNAPYWIWWFVHQCRARRRALR